MFSLLIPLHLAAFSRYGISGFPTLKFFPKNNKDGEEYEGGRDMDDFVSFINEKCGTSRDSKGQLTSKVNHALYYWLWNFLCKFDEIFLYNMAFAFQQIGWYCCVFGGAGERICKCNQ